MLGIAHIGIDDVLHAVQGDDAPAVRGNAASGSGDVAGTNLDVIAKALGQESKGCSIAIAVALARGVDVVGVGCQPVAFGLLVGTLVVRMVADPE